MYCCRVILLGLKNIILPFVSLRVDGEHFPKFCSFHEIAGDPAGLCDVKRLIHRPMPELSQQVIIGVVTRDYWNGNIDV